VGVWVCVCEACGSYVSVKRHQLTTSISFKGNADWHATPLWLGLLDNWSSCWLLMGAQQFVGVDKSVCHACCDGVGAGAANCCQTPATTATPSTTATTTFYKHDFILTSSARLRNWDTDAKQRHSTVHNSLQPTQKKADGCHKSHTNILIYIRVHVCGDCATDSLSGVTTTVASAH